MLVFNDCLVIEVNNRNPHCLWCAESNYECNTFTVVLESFKIGIFHFFKLYVNFPDSSCYSYRDVAQCDVKSYK